MRNRPCHALPYVTVQAGPNSLPVRDPPLFEDRNTLVNLHPYPVSLNSSRAPLSESLPTTFSNTIDARLQQKVLSVVIVSMNHLVKLKALLHSLYGKGKTRYSHEIILVDNCSTDGTIMYVKLHYPDVIIHQNEKIRGFAANNNHGFQLSKGEYVFICNPDIVVMPGSIDTLVNFYQENPSIGIVCPQLLNSDYTYQASVRRFHNFKILFLRTLFLGKDLVNHKVIQNYLMINFDRSKIQKVDWALGAAMLLSRNVYKHLAGFDENFFLYVEDVDLCLRSWLSGYQVIYNPQSVMVHDHSRESFKGLNKKMLYHVRSMAYFFIKHNLLFKSKYKRDNRELSLYNS